MWERQCWKHRVGTQLIPCFKKEQKESKRCERTETEREREEKCGYFKMVKWICKEMPLISHRSWQNVLQCVGEREWGREREKACVKSGLPFHPVEEQIDQNWANILHFHCCALNSKSITNPRLYTSTKNAQRANYSVQNLAKEKKKIGNKSKLIPAENNLLAHLTPQLSDVLITHTSLRLFSVPNLRKRSSQVAKKAFQVVYWFLLESLFRTQSP